MVKPTDNSYSGYTGKSTCHRRAEYGRTGGKETIKYSFHYHCINGYIQVSEQQRISLLACAADAKPRTNVFYTAVFNRVSKVISCLLWFCFTTLCDWLTKFTPVCQPMRSKTKTNRASLARVLAPVACICFEF